MGLVLGQHHRPSGSPAMAWRRSANTCSRSGSPLATRRGRRQQATCRTRRRGLRWLRAGRPSRCHSRPIVQALGWSSNLRMRWCRRGLPSGGRPARGRSPSPLVPWGVVAVDPAAHRARVAAQQLGDGRRRQAMVGQQDHDQAQGGAVRAVEQAQQVARTGGGAGGVGVHAVGGRILQAASSSRLCCGKLQRPARLLHLVGPHRRLRAEPLTIRLGCSSSPGLRVGAAQWGCTTAPAPATATPQVAAGRGSGPFPQRVGDRTDAGGRDLAEHQ